MSKLRMTLACWDYDRVKALADGTVQPEGIDLDVLPLVVEETFWRMLRHREFDAAEMSLSSYCVSLMKERKDFIAIPVFPSRMFRHSCFTISAKSGIREPKDLAGKRVGNPEYQLTAIVWMKGILQDEYGVDCASPTYFTGGEEEPGREEKLKLDLPAKFKVQPIGPTQTLSRMIADGAIDAIYAPRLPSTFYSEPDNVKRLFPNYVEVEQAYFRKTKIFPIMHVVALRRDLYEANRWIAVSLMKAFVEAQLRCYADLEMIASQKTMLPWQSAHLEETKRVMGAAWWPYGLAANRHALDTFLRYHHEQGLSQRRLSPEELFAPETFEAFKI
ncbi:MAG: ABC transporter substrate-binding protein [Stellaceae bacterium]